MTDEKTKPRKIRANPEKARERRFHHLTEDFLRVIIVQNGMTAAPNDPARDTALAADYASQVIYETERRKGDAGKEGIEPLTEPKMLAEFIEDEEPGAVVVEGGHGPGDGS
jgi:hypothetical protein